MKSAGLGPTQSHSKSPMSQWLSPHPPPTLEARLVDRPDTMSSHIKFAEPIQKKGGNGPSRRDTREKGSTQRAPSPGSEIVYPTGWRLVLTTIGYICSAKCHKAVGDECLRFVTGS
jgi:hypothetical protein